MANENDERGEVKGGSDGADDELMER